ncbi:hypothetical protein CBR_g30938 [Chara braunii]|uniref:Uncharacterized protein n=1 Tax=Chara braunii TaxID=69332 RepID=A0A388LDU1_CHABU|nr:hypothetical protein CBR_g30938 [Chara braunii]|eukprot:GBG80476.1 hypothetical protein CBR_g30938 [Chara braunii]
MEDGSSSATSLSSSGQDSSELESLRQRLQVLELENQGLKARITYLEGFNSQQEKEASSLRNELQTLKEEQDQSSSEVQNALQQAKLKVKNAKKQLESLQATVQNLKSENSVLLRRVQEAEKSSTALEAEKVELASVAALHQKKLTEAEVALKFIEAVKKKAEEEAAARAKELSEVSEKWLPPWAASRLLEWKEKATTHWEAYGKPAAIQLSRKTSVAAASAQTWAQPRLESFKGVVANSVGTIVVKSEPAVKVVREKQEEWAPIVKEHVDKAKEVMKPYVEKAHAAGVEALETAKVKLSPHWEKALVAAEPVIESIRSKARPKLEAVIVAVAPHMETARNTVVDPAMEHLGKLYEKVFAASAKYHEQLQEVVKDTLLRNDVAAVYATPSTLYHVATMFLMIPVLMVLLVFVPLFGGKKKQGPRTPDRSHPKKKKKSSDKSSKRSEKVDKQSDKSAK